MKTTFFSSHKAWLSLLLLSVVGGVWWRIEVEWVGWASLRWVGMTHPSIFGTVALLGAWIGWMTPAGRWISPGRWLVLGLLFGPLVHLLLQIFGSILFITGPGALWLLQIGLWSRYAVLFGLALFPLAFWILARRSSIKAGWPFLAASLGCLYLGPLLCIPLLRWTGQPGPADLLHTIKTGFAIPFFVLSCGLPFLGLLTAPSKDSGSSKGGSLDQKAEQKEADLGTF